MSDLGQALFEIELYGFTILEGVLSAAEAAAIRAVGERLLVDRIQLMVPLRRLAAFIRQGA